MATREAGEVRARSPSALAAALMDALPVAVACIDADERVVLVNGAFAATLPVAAGAELHGAPEPLGRLGACAREVIASGAAAELAAGGTPAWARVFPVDAQHAG